MENKVRHHQPTLDPIDLTPAAHAHIIACLKKKPQFRGVRFSVKKGGCSGFSYVVDYVEVVNQEDFAWPLEDYFIFVDKASYPYLHGMQVDYVTQGLQHKLVFQNPNQTGQCGCGESFSVE